MVRPKLHQTIETLAVDQRLKVGPHQNVRRGFASFRVPFNPDRMIRSGDGQIPHMGLKRQALRLTLTLRLKVDGNKRGIIDRDPDLFDRCDQKIIIAILAQNRGKQPDKLKPADGRSKVEPCPIPCNSHVQIATKGRIPLMDGW